MSQSLCKDHALLQSIAEGTLEGAELEQARSHLSVCPECRKAVTEYKQIMWDLSHPTDVTLPPELEQSYHVLMQEWNNERQNQTQPRLSAPSLVPAWAAFSVSWTRQLPLVNTLGSILRRTGTAVIDQSLPRWIRRKGGDRH